MDMNQNVTMEQIKAAVSGWAASFTSARESMHKALILCAIHAEKHNNVTGFQVVITALEKDGKGQNNVAVIDWINRFTKGQVSYDKEAKTHKVEFAEKKQTMLDKGKEKPWYELKPQKNFVGFDVAQQLATLDATVNKKTRERQALIDAGKMADAEKIKIDPDLMRAIRLLRTDRRLVDMVNNTVKEKEGAQPEQIEQPKQAVNE